jgi:hypothetical protein
MDRFHFECTFAQRVPVCLGLFALSLSSSELGGVRISGVAEKPSPARRESVVA